MSILLDTHTALWYFLDDPRLTARAREHVRVHEGKVYVSIASVWELAIKISRGKYAIDLPFDTFWTRHLTENDFTLLSPSIPHLAKVAELSHFHGDPFDRLIIAQAISENFPLVSCDDLLDQYPITRIW